MKKIINIIMTLVGIALLSASCSQMNDSHLEFVSGGEIVYRAKPDSVVGYAGKNRVQLDWELNFPTLVVKCEIREGDRVLADIPVTYQDHLKFSQILEDLEERVYTFSIYSLDAAGNSSIKSNVIVEVFGDNYINILRTTRSIQDVLRSAENRNVAFITLSAPTTTKIEATTIFYKSTAGTEKSVRVLGTQHSVEISDAAEDSYFNIQDLWRPVADAIDLFPAAIKKYPSIELPEKSIRRFTSIYRDHTTVYATLSASRMGTKESIIQYDGKEVVVEANVNSIKIENVLPTTQLSLVTYVQEAGSGKIYVTSPIQVAVSGLLEKVNMAQWQVVDFSSQQESGEGAGGGHASHGIDDDLTTFWHTQYSPAQPLFPHHLTVDMNEPMAMKAIAVARRNGNDNFPAKMKLEVSTDGVNWQLAGEFSPNNTVDGLQRFSLDAVVTGRYFRLTALSSATSSTFTCISEINLFK